MRFGLLSLLIASSAQAAFNNWVVWNQPPASYNYTNPINYARSASGYVIVPTVNGGTERVNVTFSGEVYVASEFNGSGYNMDIFNNRSTFLSDTVTVLPPSGNFIATTGYSGLINTITFSKPVTNFVMAVESLGGSQDSAYSFNHDFTIVSRGQGYFDYPWIPLSMLDSHTLYSKGGSGVIQFNGTFTSFSWSVPRPEIYSAFNFGLSDTASLVNPATFLWNGARPDFYVPESSTYGLIGVCALSIAVVARRRKLKSAKVATLV